MPWGGASSPPPPQLLTHGFTLRDLLGAATRDDLFYTGMRCPPGGGRGTTWGDASLGPPPAPYPPPNRRGSAYRLWAAIVQHRRDHRHGEDGGGTRPSEQ